MPDADLVRKGRKGKKKAAENSAVAAVAEEEADIAKAEEDLHVSNVNSAVLVMVPKEAKVGRAVKKSVRILPEVDRINQDQNVRDKVAETRTPRTLSVNTDNGLIF